MLDGIEGVMNLAAASGEDLASVSDIVTDSLTAFGLSAAEAGHFADLLAAASANSNTNVAMLGEAFKYCAPVAGALGYEVEHVTAALGLMANAGIKGSAAGTALRTLMTNLAKPTKSARAAIEELGVSMDDGSGNALSLRDVLVQLRTGFSNVGSVSAEVAAALEEDSEDATDAVRAAADAQYNAFKDSLDARYDAAKAAFDDQYDAAKDSYDAQYKAAQKAYSKQLDALKDSLDAEYEALKNSLDAAYEAEQERLNNVYEERKSAYDDEYAALKDKLDNEYNAQKSAFDKEYNALKESLDNAYNAKKTKFDKEYDALKEKLNDEYDVQKSAFDKEYDELKKTQEKALDALKSSQEKEITALEQASEKRIAVIMKTCTDSSKLSMTR